LLALLDRAKSDLEIASDKPDGYNIGINDGPAAGQTVPHLHIHLIPRRTGDVADPRGGVRWIIPEKAAYWEMMKPVARSGDAT
jgi:diadenosine tetraphosphate (Ap4A) HIT family hydrolase